MQFQPADSNLETVNGIVGRLSITREQTQRPIAALVLIENLRRLEPSEFLPVVDLAPIRY